METVMYLITTLLMDLVGKGMNIFSHGCCSNWWFSDSLHIIANGRVNFNLTELSMVNWANWYWLEKKNQLQCSIIKSEEQSRREGVNRNSPNLGVVLIYQYPWNR